MVAVDISAAAHECVANCRNSDNPRLEVTVFTRILVTDLGWTLSDAQEVACYALRLHAEQLSHAATQHS